ncbi:MAG: hypothetical protein ABEJ55_08305 [Halanaeroarchaeum sp.]
MDSTESIRTESDCRTPDESDDAGQIAVGTLVILIAAILVATATAGVLLQTAGVLQSESADASDQIANRVSPDLSIVTATGVVNQSAADPVVEDVRVIVTSGEGNDGADLSDAQVRVVGPTERAVLSYSRTGPTRGETFGVEALVDRDDSAPVLSQSSDRFAVVVATESLAPGDRLTVEVLLESGRSTTVRVAVPEQLDGESAVELR